MARLTAADRRKIPKDEFAEPSKAPGPGSYPIEDKRHARSALSLVSADGTPAEKARVDADVHRKFPTIGQSSR